MLNAINKRLQQAFPLNSESLFDTIQENDTRDLFETFTHGVGVLGYQTEAFTVITGRGQQTIPSKT